MRKKLSLWLFIGAGIAIAIWAVLGLIYPSITCRGVEMGPGDQCARSSITNVDTGEVQTYEQRLASARSQAPIGIVLGLAMAAFGGYLVLHSGADHGSRDIGP